jgi:polysaccharide pyruvyl transferase WcaK-like protein
VTPHVTIIGSALSGNKGAAAMLEAAVDTITERVPGTRFTLLSMYPEEDRGHNQRADLDIVPAAPRQLGVTINALALVYRVVPPLRRLLRRRSRAIEALTSSQVLLDQGGITFSDGREKFLLYNVASVLPALLVGTPVFKCAQAVGPFESRINRLAARAVLPRMHTIVTRGSRTHSFAEQLGLRNLHRGADYAFALDLRGDEAAIADRHVEPAFFDSGPTVVGIAPSTVLAEKLAPAGRSYVDEMVDFSDRLTAAGHRVLLVPHSVRVGTERTHNNDLPLCREIHGRLDRRASVRFLDAEVSSQVLRHLIGRCDVFVTSRFHAMVSSLAVGVPPLVVGWSHKYEEVLEPFGLEAWAMGHEEFSADHLWNRFSALLERREDVTDQLVRALPAVRSRALEQADLIATLVRDG